MYRYSVYASSIRYWRQNAYKMVPTRSSRPDLTTVDNLLYTSPDTPTTIGTAQKQRGKFGRWIESSPLIGGGGDGDRWVF